MSVTIKRLGYGQLEPNHLSASYTGGVYADLPATVAKDETEEELKNAIQELEQGMFIKYSVASQEATFKEAAVGPWMLVYNEEKLYDERHQMHKDFALRTVDSDTGRIYPRVFRIEEGDLFTTNTVVEDTYSVGDQLVIETGEHEANRGRLKKGVAAPGQHSFVVVKETTMPDMQPAVQVQVLA